MIIGCDNKAGGDISSEVPFSSPPASTRTVKPSIITPELIRPFPKAGARKGKARTQRMKRTRILTDTPEKKLLEEAEAIRLQRRAKPVCKKSSRKTAVKKSVSPKLSARARDHKKQIQEQDTHSDDSQDLSDDEPLAKLAKSSDSEPCSGCRCRYGDKRDPKAGELWIACSCGKWFHESCAERDGILDDDVFICQQCC